MSMFSFSYWIPNHRRHYIGWVSAESSEDAVAKIAERFKAVSQHTWSIPFGPTNFHPAGQFYFDGQPSTDDAVRFARDWHVGIPPKVKYLFVSETEFWASKSPMWTQEYIDYYQVLDIVDGACKLVWAFAYVMPPYCQINNMRIESAPKIVQNSERLASLSSEMMQKSEPLG